MVDPIEFNEIHALVVKRWRVKGLGKVGVRREGNCEVSVETWDIGSNNAVALSRGILFD